MTRNRKEALTFGVMCSGKRLHAWQKECIHQLLDIEKVKLDLVIEDYRQKRLKNKLKNIRPSQLLFQVCKKIFFGYESGRTVSAEDIFSGVDNMRIDSLQVERYSEYFPDDKIEKIKDQNLDFIIRFGFGIIRGEILDSAKYGVWSFHHDDERKYRGGPPCFWEVYHGDERTGFVLQRLTDRLDGGVILKRGSVKTAQTSYTANMDRVYRASTNLPAEVCRDILSSGSSPVGEESSSEAPIYSYPTNSEFMIFIGKTICRKISEYFR